MTDRPLWTPSAARMAEANLTRFVAAANARHGLRLTGFRDTLRFSVEQPEAFWSLLVGFLRRQGGDARQPRARRWRQDAGRPLLSRRPAELCREPARQVGRQRRAGLPRRRQGRAPHELAGAERPRRADCTGRWPPPGSGPGDRVCAVVPNMPESIVSFLAVASLGAIWSSCSPDFGERGILDRFGQIEPRLLITCDGYYYAGKTIRMADKIGNVLKELKTVDAGRGDRLYRERRSPSPRRCPGAASFAGIPRRP